MTVVASALSLTSRVWKHTASRVARAICALFVNCVNPMITLQNTLRELVRPTVMFCC